MVALFEDQASISARFLHHSFGLTAIVGENTAHTHASERNKNKQKAKAKAKAVKPPWSVGESRSRHLYF